MLLVLAALATSFHSPAHAESSPKQIMDQVISVFENSTTTLQYDYIKILNDGRGYTAGRAGFTSRDGDLLEVVENYLMLNPHSEFQTIKRELRKAAREERSSTEGLETLPQIWKNAAQDPLFTKVQDRVSDATYYRPVLIRAKKFKIYTKLGVLCFYDTAIEHGIEGKDGLDDILSTLKRAQFKSEADYLRTFLLRRREVLLNPADPSTKIAWANSVSRVDALLQLLKDENLELETPFSIYANQGTYTIH